jgi:hypothetical protein
VLRHRVGDRHATQVGAAERRTALWLTHSSGACQQIAGAVRCVPLTCVGLLILFADQRTASFRRSSFLPEVLLNAADQLLNRAVGCKMTAAEFARLIAMAMAERAGLVVPQLPERFQR